MCCASAEPPTRWPLGSFLDATFSIATFIGLAIDQTLYGTIFVLALHLQQQLGYWLIEARLAFLPNPDVLGIAVAAGPIGHRFGLRRALGLLIGA